MTTAATYAAFLAFFPAPTEEDLLNLLNRAELQETAATYTARDENEAARIRRTPNTVSLARRIMAWVADQRDAAAAAERDEAARAAHTPTQQGLPLQAATEETTGCTEGWYADGDAGEPAPEPEPKLDSEEENAAAGEAMTDSGLDALAEGGEAPDEAPAAATGYAAFHADGSVNVQATPAPTTHAEADALLADVLRNRVAKTATKLDVADLQALYTIIFGRPSTSDNRRYLEWKVRGAATGKDPRIVLGVNQRQPRAAATTDAQPKSVTIRLTDEEADALDALVAQARTSSRAAFVRTALEAALRAAAGATEMVSGF